MLGGQYFSNVDEDTIAQHEGGNRLKAYVLPVVQFPNSGITVGIGVDLGQQTASGLLGMGLPQNLINVLNPYLICRAQAAADTLAANPLTLTADQANQLNNAVLTWYCNQTGQQFDLACGFAQFSDLPWQGQTVIADLAYNLGNLSKSAPDFWSQVTSGDWQAAYDNLMDFTDPKASPTLYARAQDDGRILLQAIQADTLPTP